MPNIFGNETSSEYKQRKQHEYDVEMFEREARFNADQAQLSYDRQRDFYNYQFERESDYNSPLRQMQRYKAAGLNPALVAQGISSGETSVSSSSPSSASASGSNTVDVVGSYNSTIQALQGLSDMSQGLGSLASQIELNNSVIDKNYAEANKIRGADTRESESRTSKNIQDTKTSAAQEENIKSNTKLTEKQVEHVEADTKRLTFMVEKYMPQEMKESVKRMQQMETDIWQRQQVTPAEIAKFRQEVAESASRVKLNERQEQLLQKELDWYDQRVAADLAISKQQFQQLCSNNEVLKLKNSISSDVLRSKNVNGLWNDSQFRENIYKLRALELLTPSPGLAPLEQGSGIIKNLGQTYDLFKSKNKSSNIRGYLP